jgi:hypothetical protein
VEFCEEMANKGKMVIVAALGIAQITQRLSE